MSLSLHIYETVAKFYTKFLIKICQNQRKQTEKWQLECPKLFS